MIRQARDAFVQSLAHDEAYMVREGMNPINNWNYVHNLDYLVAAAAESGRLAEGLKYARILASLPADAGRLRAQGIGYMLYGGHTAIARLHMRYARWREAKAAIEEARKKITFDDPLLEGYYDGLAIYTGAMAALASDDVAGARAAAAALDALWTPLSQQRAQNAGDWYFRHAIRVLDVHRIELKALIESAQGSHDEAIATLTDAARRERDLGYWEPPHYTRPVLESLGAACARAGRWDEAKAAFEAALERRPRSGHPLAGLARAAARSNRPQEAAAAWRRLLKVWADADPDLPEMIEAARRP